MQETGREVEKEREVDNNNAPSAHEGIKFLVLLSSYSESDERIPCLTFSNNLGTRKSAEKIISWRNVSNFYFSISTAPVLLFLQLEAIHWVAPNNSYSQSTVSSSVSPIGFIGQRRVPEKIRAFQAGVLMEIICGKGWPHVVKKESPHVKSAHVREGRRKKRRPL